MSVSVRAEVVMKRSYGIASDEERARGCGDRDERTRARRAALDPGEEGDAEERREVEHVPLLDPVGERREAKAATTGTTQIATATVAARKACSRASSERADPTSTIVAASGITSMYSDELGDVPPEVAKRARRARIPRRRPGSTRRADPASERAGAELRRRARLTAPTTIPYSAR